MLADLVRQLPHHPLIPVSGRFNAELWGEWKLGSPQQMQGVLDLRDAQLSSQIGPLIVDHLNSRFNFQIHSPQGLAFGPVRPDVGYAGAQWQSERLSVARNLPATWVSGSVLIMWSWNIRCS